MNGYRRAEQGFRGKHFWNNEVRNHTDAAVACIVAAAGHPADTFPGTSPRGAPPSPATGEANDDR
ncbi:hypothetical protein OCA5_c15450 [Afipia carboxidovorans OM5]|uniref:Uncharacterized protein n=1 Tax=Afipia carboxidovorans (strain ATCC 49405 / DSM 1227 / KCTC 32145 / OM5) TaxID=504832 RepID=F8BZ65_AFIC5|nr:hypothetical protein OCA4_c15450 [Afipia carboxidovorans OM4]AEI06261.1 hypothetical protein OCA5_c15450 [Afipia carboxidovorans OM5]